ncbi:Guanylate kinase, partial [hydrothermal vent metagenome]
AAKSEMEQKEKFDYVIVNDDLDTAVKELIAAINAERALR